MPEEGWLTGEGAMAARGRAWAARLGRRHPLVAWVCFAYHKFDGSQHADLGAQTAESREVMNRDLGELFRYLPGSDVGVGHTRGEVLQYACAVRDYCRAIDRAAAAE